MARAVAARRSVVQVLQDATLVHEMGVFALVTQLHQLMLEVLQLLHLDSNKLDVVVEQVVHSLALHSRLRLEI
jgi:hypothetical protein